MVRSNVATTECAAFIVTTQAPVPVQSPDQPEKVEPSAGVGVRVTIVPSAKLALHIPGQEIPAGLLLTVPVPVPDNVADKAYVVTALI
jgi:hypothetical protein